MLSREYLLYGLNALSRASAGSYFEDGHRGGAIISAFYFCAEARVEDGVAPLLAHKIDERWANTGLCTAFPDGEAQPELIGKILDAISSQTSGLRQAGHNVILPALALKAFQDIPESITATRIDGICQLIQRFTVSDVPVSEPPIELPEPADSAVFSEFILQEFIQCTERFQGRGQGWSGHLLTYARALVDLSELGYSAVVEKARDGFVTYIRRIRLGPLETDQPRTEHVPMNGTPLQEKYWLERKGDWNLGHAVKYPYGFYGLFRHVEDQTLKDRCMAVAHSVL